MEKNVNVNTNLGPHLTTLAEVSRIKYNFGWSYTLVYFSIAVISFTVNKYFRHVITLTPDFQF